MVEYRSPICLSRFFFFFSGADAKKKVYFLLSLIAFTIRIVDLSFFKSWCILRHLDSGVHPKKDNEAGEASTAQDL